MAEKINYNEIVGDDVQKGLDQLEMTDIHLNRISA